MITEGQISKAGERVREEICKIKLMLHIGSYMQICKIKLARATCLRQKPEEHILSNMRQYALCIPIYSNITTNMLNCVCQYAAESYVPIFKISLHTNMQHHEGQYSAMHCSIICQYASESYAPICNSSSGQMPPPSL